MTRWYFSFLFALISSLAYGQLLSTEPGRHLYGEGPQASRSEILRYANGLPWEEAANIAKDNADRSEDHRENAKKARAEGRNQDAERYDNAAKNLREAADAYTEAALNNGSPGT